VIPNVQMANLTEDKHKSRKNGVQNTLPLVTLR
jgi:hypothetical protein